jgi:OHCU decarboxylase
VRLIAEDGSFDYVSDSYADDLPYWTHNGSQLVIPYTLDANDMRFATPQGFNAGDQFFAYLRDSFDVLYAEGQAGAPKMMSIGLHCRLIGRPGRAAALQKFIDYVAAHDDVWVPRRIDIAEHWATEHPYVAPRFVPSQMEKTAFMEVFGSIYEHSPWIEERAFDGELGPAHDTPAGLHAAFARQFRSASQEERLSVLQAHPDLAGKLAAAKRLTAESTTEQASAGLDALTDAERASFSDLNQRYIDTFGFPFIIAVRDHDKASILAAFHQRLTNTRAEEFAQACAQVDRIALHRLKDLFA